MSIKTSNIKRTNNSQVDISNETMKTKDPYLKIKKLSMQVRMNIQW